MLAKRGFHAIEIDASTANLDLPVVAPESLNQPIRPLAHEVARSKDPGCSRVASNCAFRHATSIDPMSQRGVGACDQELADFTPRHGAAEVTGDFEWFKHMVYEHTTGQREQWALLDRSLQPVTPFVGGPPGRNRIRMGNYSRQRLPEPMLKEIWDWMNDLGVHLAVLRGRITAGEAGPSGATYTVEVINTGVKGKGITNEDVTVAIALPAGTKVVSAAGGGYEGVRHDAEAKSDVAVWRVPRLAAGDRQSFTITLAAPATALRGTIRWAKPAVKADDEVTFALATGRGGRAAGAL